ncbi:MAG: glycosyltransferase [Firmicutes bacterium]|nr:glycosyltransferase [Bacillota bacterium]
MCIKVLHVIPTLDPINGGPVNAIEGLTSSLHNHNVKVEILAPYREGESLVVANRLKQQNIKVTRVGPVRGAIGYHPQLKTIAYKAVSRNDVTHIHSLWEDVQHHAARASQKQKKPYIIRPCGMLDPWSLNQSKYRKKIYLALRLRKNLNRATALHFTAQAEHDLTRPLNLKPPGIIEPNGLNLSEFETLPSPNAFRNAHPEIGDRPYILFLSRIHPKKGVNLLIPAFTDAAPPNCTLVIAGPSEPDYLALIKQLTVKHGIEDRVLFPGMLAGEVKHAAYAEAMLFILPSYQENFGIVVIEALACGTPVVTTTAVNLSDALMNKPFAFISTPDVEGVTDALRKALAQQCTNAKSQRSITFVYENFGWDQIAKNWAKHYDEITSHQDSL